MRQTQYEGGGRICIREGGGSAADPVGGKNAEAAVILESYVQGRPGQQRFVEQLGKQNFQRAPESMLWLHAGIRSQNVKAQDKGDLSCDLCCGRWLPAQPGGGDYGHGWKSSGSFSRPGSPGLSLGEDGAKSLCGPFRLN